MLLCVSKSKGRKLDLELLFFVHGHVSTRNAFAASTLLPPRWIFSLSSASHQYANLDVMPRGPLKRTASITDLRFTLRRVFGKDAFRPLQEEVITEVVAGHDVFLCAATSFGKSLCYQLPAVVSLGVTVVISPLLALMENQVQAAKSLGIAVEMINGKTDWLDRKRIETDLLCGHPETKILYITPELLAHDRFRSIITKIHRQGQLIRIACDEAHCISEWGHDFRTAYKDLIWLKQSLVLPSVPIMAVTATATPQVRDDIFKFLGLDHTKTKCFSTSTARPNIHYEVQYFSESNPKNGDDDMFAYLISKLEFMHHRRLLLLKHKQEQDPRATVPSITGIIYVNMRAAADNLASRLSAAGIRASAYHAGLEQDRREKIQTLFERHAKVDPRLLPPTTNANSDLEHISTSFNIITATTAFGMGIDVPSIRFVIHYGLPRGMESFTQESGRAGRDNRAASSIILYTREDMQRCEYRTMCELKKTRSDAKRQALQESLRSIVGFCENTGTCRHELVSRYFGDKKQSTSCYFACDVCNEGSVKLGRRKEKGLASAEEAFEFTQREPRRTYDEYE
jgi:superfamily II DNA helicase RecQ